jgi:hypothetical protein
MTKEKALPKPAYEKPAIQELGKFAQLTLGSKWHSFSDLSQGIGTAISDGGIGS